VTQPPDDHTQRFDPYRDDDSTRAMPPVPPGNGDDATQFFPFDDDRTRQVPPYDPSRDDATRVYGAPADATAAMPPVSGGPVRGSAAPVPPTGNVYGGTPPSAYPGYDDEYEPEQPGRNGKRTALIVGGIVAAVALVVLAGMALGSAVLGSGDPAPSAAPVVSLAPTPSETLTETPEESLSPSDEFTVSPPPPEGPGPRILAIEAPERVQCDGEGHDAQVELSWTVRSTDKVVVSKDGAAYQEYAPDDSPVTVPFPCDGQAHKYQVTAFSNDDRQSQPRQITVRPEAAQQTTEPLFPAPSAS
jgi:hypothetical protein